MNGFTDCSYYKYAYAIHVHGYIADAAHAVIYMLYNFYGCLAINCRPRLCAHRHLWRYTVAPASMHRRAFMRIVHML